MSQYDLCVALLAEITRCSIEHHKQATDKQMQFAKFAEEQDRTFAQKVPETRDREKAGEIQTRAREMLKSLGFSTEQLVRGWIGEEQFSLRDRRLQMLVYRCLTA